MAPLSKSHSTILRPTGNERVDSLDRFIKVGQINLHRSQAGIASSMTVLKAMMQQSKSYKDSNVSSLQGFVMALQEPPLHKGSVCGLDRRNRIISKDGSSPRAALMLSSNIDVWQMDEYTDRDIATGMIIPYNSQNSNNMRNAVVVTSVYLDILDNKVWPNAFRKLVRTCEQRGWALIALMDSNAHSTLWGCEIPNHRGEVFEQLLAGTGLQVMNVGTKPTFYNYRCSSIIDVTLASPSAAVRIAEWKVTEGVVGTDHNLISMDFTISTCKITRTRNWKGDYKSFQSLLEEHPFKLPKRWNEEILEDMAIDLTRDITEALDNTHPLVPIKTQVREYKWWNSSCMDLQKKAHKALKIAKSHHSEENVQKARDLRKAYSKTIRRAKRESWKMFTESCHTPQELSKLVKILKGQRNHTLGILRKPDNTFCANPREVLELLANTHFPRNVAASDTVPSHSTGTPLSEEVKFITTHSVREAIKSFGDLKAAGPDGIKPIVLKNLGEKALSRLTLLLRASSTLGYIPNCWNKSNVIFIPKPGKDDYSNPKAFRPITLSSFFLKTLERLWDWELNKTVLKDRPLCLQQHAFRKGFSTESALSNMVEHIEKGMITKGFALASFLDIQGAFDNVPTTGVIQAMRNKGLPPLFLKWYTFLLRSRSFSIHTGGVKLRRKPTMGTPQGGVLSPKIWNLVFESFLQLFHTGPVKVVGCADDAGLVVEGTEPTQMAVQMQEAINKALEWGNSNGLSFNASKTEIILFTRKRKFHVPQAINMLGQEVPYVSHAKYLGVWLDSKLSWTFHLNKKIKSTKALLNQSKAAIGKLWGPSPRAMAYVYRSIIRTAFTYGALVWSNVCKTVAVQKKLESLQRLFLLSLGHFRRSSPTAGLEIITGTEPLHLWIRQEAAKGYLRTKKHIKLDPSLLLTRNPVMRGHRQITRRIIREMELPEEQTDEMEPVPNERHDYKISSTSLDVAANKQNIDPNPRRGTISIYTDGAKLNSLAGSGFVVYKDLVMTHSFSAHLGVEPTVFQAEAHAIQQAAEYVRANHHNDNAQIRLFSDSQAALRALSSKTIHSRVIQKCVDSLNYASSTNTVTLFWIKAHSNHIGNEKADEAAKKGAEDINSPIPQALPIPRSAYKTFFQEWLISKWNEQWKARKDCRQTKDWFDEVRLDESKKIMSLDRKHLSRAVQIITGHNFMLRHQHVVDPEQDSTCRLCLEDEESTWHVIAECPALGRIRQEHFGAPVLTKPLTWSSRMAALLTENTIGHLADWNELDVPDDVEEVFRGGE